MFIGNRLEFVNYETYLRNSDDVYSARKTGSKKKVFRCKYCSYQVGDKYSLGTHYDTKHRDMIPDDMDGYRWCYYLQTGKDRGSCIICKKETEFNRKNMKYSRFCPDPKCKETYREQFKERMIGKYGKIHMLDDPEVQRRMLANRKISGTYEYSDGTKFTYTGSYELDFLVTLDTKLKWSSSDIMAPSPHVYKYEYKGEDHFYMPDFFLPSQNLEVEIKDDGSAKQINEESREKDVIKDELMRSNASYINYIKIIGKDYTEFMQLIGEGQSDG